MLAEGGNNSAQAQMSAERNPMKLDKIGEFQGVEERNIAGEEQGLGSPSRF
jgi:hypothetical protein